MNYSLDYLSEIATNWRAADLSSLSILIKWYCNQTGEERPCMGCELEKSNFIHRVISYIAIKRKTGEMASQDWKLKTNSIFSFRYGGSTHLSNANLTEEKAIEFLKANKNRIQVFVQYPANWEDLVDGVNNKKVKNPIEEAPLFDKLTAETKPKKSRKKAN